MKKHLVVTGLKTRFGAESNFMNNEGILVKDYHLVFRELFCTAAADLADDLHQPLEKLGVMFDDIVSTDQERKRNRFMSDKRAAYIDLEKEGLELEATGKGQLLFLVRSVDQHEADRLQGAGYRFADTIHLIPILGEIFRIRQADLRQKLDEMYHYSTAIETLDPGVHFGLFCVRARFGAGFEILTRKSGRNLLPTMQIPTGILEEWQIEFLKGMDGENVSTCLKMFNRTAVAKSSPPIEKLFASRLRCSLEQLQEEINDDFFNDARLIGTPVQVPCRGEDEYSLPSEALVFVFRIVTPLQTRPPGNKLCYVPMTLFKTRQHVLKNAPDHEIFARRTYRDFASMLDLESRPNTIDFLTPPGSPPHVPYLPILKNMPPVLKLKKKISDKLRLNRRSHSVEEHIIETIFMEQPKRLGGIMIMSEVNVDHVHRKVFGETQGRVLDINIINKAVKEEEVPEFVDELLKLSMKLR